MDSTANSSAGRLGTTTEGSAIEALVGLSSADAAGRSERGDGAEAGAAEQGSGRLSSLVPTLGRMATRAHRASAPYLTYAAMASQEAARYSSRVLLLYASYEYG